MSLHRFFLPEQVLSEEEGPAFALRLSEEDAHHARVLRIKPGEHVAVVDAAGDYFECRIEESSPALRASIAARGEAGEPAWRITLLQGLAKGDRMEAVVRHATEVGAHAFLPFSSARTVVRLDAAKAARKQQRWASVAKSAAMQAGRGAVPEVLAPATFAQACEFVRPFDAVVVFWEEAGPQDALALALEGARGVEAAQVALVVGPEGGLAPEEVDALLAANPSARIASLGPNILRTETAAVVGCALSAYELSGQGRMAASPRESA